MVSVTLAVQINSTWQGRTRGFGAGLASPYLASPIPRPHFPIWRKPWTSPPVHRGNGRGSWHSARGPAAPAALTRGPPGSPCRSCPPGGATVGKGEPHFPDTGPRGQEGSQARPVAQEFWDMRPKGSRVSLGTSALVLPAPPPSTAQTSSIRIRGFSVFVFFKHWIIFPGMAPTYVRLWNSTWLGSGQTPIPGATAERGRAGRLGGWGVEASSLKTWPNF